MKLAGFVLLALGVLGLLYGGLRYTTRDTVLDVGPIHATAEREHNIPVAPLAAGLVLCAGAAMIIASRRKA